ncbi:MAG: hypothetical protein ACRBK7_14505 [Acidimicrobiales bacterium]
MGDSNQPTPPEGHALPWMRLAGLAAIVAFAVLDAFTPWELSDRILLAVLGLVLGSAVDASRLLPGRNHDRD